MKIIGTNDRNHLLKQIVLLHCTMFLVISTEGA